MSFVDERVCFSSKPCCLLLCFTNGLLNMWQYLWNGFPHLQWEDERFSDLYIYKSSWFVENPCRNHRSVSSYWAFSAARRSEVIAYRPSPPGTRSLVADGLGWPCLLWGRFSPSVEGRVSSSPCRTDWLTDVRGSPPGPQGLYHTPPLRSKWKEIMSLIKAISEHQSFIRKDRRSRLSNCSQAALC